MHVRRSLLLVAPLVLAIAVTQPAHAMRPVRATVQVSEGWYPVTGAGATSAPCEVRLAPARTSALDALIAATRAGCVSSYEVDDTPDGHYLRCVDGRCESLGFYWAIYLDGQLACTGMDEVVVCPQDEVTFSYEAYPTALALATC